MALPCEAILRILPENRQFDRKHMRKLMSAGTHTKAQLEIFKDKSNKSPGGQRICLLRDSPDVNNSRFFFKES